MRGAQGRRTSQSHTKPSFAWAHWNTAAGRTVLDPGMFLRTLLRERRAGQSARRWTFVQERRLEPRPRGRRDGAVAEPDKGT